MIQYNQKEARTDVGGLGEDVINNAAAQLNAIETTYQVLKSTNRYQNIVGIALLHPRYKRCWQAQPNQIESNRNPTEPNQALFFTDKRYWKYKHANSIITNKSFFNTISINKGYHALTPSCIHRCIIRGTTVLPQSYTIPLYKTIQAHKTPYFLKKTILPKPKTSYYHITILPCNTWGAKATLAAMHLRDPLLDRVHPPAHAADAFYGGHVAPVHGALQKKSKGIGSLPRQSKITTQGCILR